MTTPTVSRNRIYSIDILRGLVMMIMALDHVRDYLHITAATDSPTNLATTTPALFFTRWITHFCAPIFVFLAGCSAYLSGRRKTTRELGQFLIKRGFWLILVELVIVTFGWTFNPLYNNFILQVIWATGIAMILLGLCVRLPYVVVLVTGLVIVCLHNLLDYPEAAVHGQVGFWDDLIHHGMFSIYSFHFAPTHHFIILYAFLPWTGILFLGYGFGRFFETHITAAARKKTFLLLGTGMILAFIIIRFVNGYGDPKGWSGQRSPLFSLLSFVNVNKYPPSLDYILMTLGTGIVCLGLFERARPQSYRIPIVFGRVPFFYYILHLYLIHLIGMIIFFAEGYPAKDIAPQSFPFLFRPDHFGFGLFAVYAIWVGVLVILLPICNWYNKYKDTHKQWWLSYL